ncbi:hypothetical protein HMPREF1547_02559 [Blautia sp. KLE 1732]|nr:hypothetical protein HMPREF1547_02559 [Blautia sp. KLE 1732]
MKYILTPVFLKCKKKLKKFLIFFTGCIIMGGKVRQTYGICLF